MAVLPLVSPPGEGFFGLSLSLTAFLSNRILPVAGKRGILPGRRLSTAARNGWDPGIRGLLFYW